VETGLVFTTRHGTPIEPSNFDRSFNGRITMAGVPRITRHSARKTCGSLLAAPDVHPRVAMQILRHGKVAITMEIYTEVPSATTREALRKLGQWLDDAPALTGMTPDRRLTGDCCTLLLHQDHQRPVP
jgi:integrase